MRLRPKRPILRAQLAAMNPPAPVNMRSGAAWRNADAYRFYHGGMWPGASAVDLQLAAASGGRRAEICWWTGSPADAKCCSYEGMQLPVCVTYPDVE